jgi:hypothetical protein
VFKEYRSWQKERNKVQFFDARGDAHKKTSDFFLVQPEWERCLKQDIIKIPTLAPKCTQKQMAIFIFLPISAHAFALAG